METEKKFFIIIVEDDEGIRTALEELLKGEDFEVVVFANGKEAKEYIDASLRFVPPPDVILTDINMPEMDGLDLLKFLAGKYRLPKILAMTGRFKESSPLMIAMSGNIENKGFALAAGADIFLLKPIRGVGEKIKELLISR